MRYFGVGFITSKKLIEFRELTSEIEKQMRKIDRWFMATTLYTVILVIAVLYSVTRIDTAPTPEKYFIIAGDFLLWIGAVYIGLQLKFSYSKARALINRLEQFSWNDKET